MSNGRLKLLHEPETEDPILSVVNLIDIFLVIIAALLITVAKNPLLNPFSRQDVTIITDPGKASMEMLVKKGTKKDLTGLTSPENDVPLGTGELDIPAILKAAQKAGVKHYFIEDESSNIITSVPQSIAYLKSLTK